MYYLINWFLFETDSLHFFNLMYAIFIIINMIVNDLVLGSGRPCLFHYTIWLLELIFERRNSLNGPIVLGNLYTNRSAY